MIACSRARAQKAPPTGGFRAEIRARDLARLPEIGRKALSVSVRSFSCPELSVRTAVQVGSRTGVVHDPRADESACVGRAESIHARPPPDRASRPLAPVCPQTGASLSDMHGLHGTSQAI